MKKIFLSIFLLCSIYHSFAIDYYFSSTLGNDARTATQARNPASPWKSITKLNQIFSTLLPGDRILFKRGDVFFGSIVINKSGSSTKPITLTAYGTGAKPVISGLTTLTSWVSLGGGLYQTYNAAFSAPVLNMVTVNNVNTPVGRYPNRNATEKGYKYFESHGTKSITDKELLSSPNWVGGEVALRSRHWSIDRIKITAHSGSTIAYATNASYSLFDGYGYFVQNHIKTLDQVGEWAYSPSTKKLTMFFGANLPSKYSVKAATVKDLIYNYNHDYITIDNLSLQGCNENNIDVYSSSNFKIQNCDINNSGISGVYAQSTSSLLIENNSIDNSNNIGLDLSSSNSAIIRNNKINASGIYAGMGITGYNSHHGIRVMGDNVLIEYNDVDSSGYCGIRFNGNNTNIRNNYISNFCFIKDDGGGINTGEPAGTERYGRKITNNIIINGMGAKEGTKDKEVQQASGIYLDNNTSGVAVTGNTVSNCGKIGIYVHNAFKISVLNNTTFANTIQVWVCHDNVNMAKVTNLNMKNNIFFSKVAEQKVAQFYTKLTEMKSFGVIDSNYYARPLNELSTIQGITGVYGTTQKTTLYTLDTWKLAYGHDLHSKKSPKTFSSATNPNDVIRFEYNPTRTNKQVTLNATYVDVKNKSYSGTITIAPYSSLVLIKSGIASTTAVSLPVVKITSPLVNAQYNAPASIRLTASATVSGASISKVEFYRGSTLITTEKIYPYDWAWTNVPAGTYSITAKAYASNGAVSTSSPVTVYVRTASAAVVEPSVPGNNSSQSSGFRLYPNPTRDRIYVEFSGPLQNEQVNVILANSAGGTIQRFTKKLYGNIVDFDVSSLLRGVYVLSIVSKSGIYSRTFIKE